MGFCKMMATFPVFSIPSGSSIAESGFTRIQNTATIHDEHADEFEPRELVFRVAACTSRVGIAAGDTTLVMGATVDFV
jgi:hypothetical protein